MVLLVCLLASSSSATASEATSSGLPPASSLGSMEATTPQESSIRSFGYHRQLGSPANPPHQLQSHLYKQFVSGDTSDILVHVWFGSCDTNVIYKLHRIVLTQAVRRHRVVVPSQSCTVMTHIGRTSFVLCLIPASQNHLRTPIFYRARCTSDSIMTPILQGLVRIHHL